MITANTSSLDRLDKEAETSEVLGLTFDPIDSNQGRGEAALRWQLMLSPLFKMIPRIILSYGVAKGILEPKSDDPASLSILDSRIAITLHASDPCGTLIIKLGLCMLLESE